MSAPEQPQLRPAWEVQRAHDLIVAVLMGSLAESLPGHTGKAMIAAADVLCWVLRHDHNQTFAKCLKSLEEHMAEHGMALYDSGQINHPKEPS